MMKNIKVSVIIPVYNAEKHLHTCIKSLQAQSLSQIEFIFINDGSTDNSLEILQSFAKDSRIKIFSQQNKGVSAARNVGIKHAVGDYIGFLDADDQHMPQMYETLYNEAIHEDLDILVSNIFLERDNKQIPKKASFLRDESYSSEEIKNKIIPYILAIEDIALIIVSNKIYKRSLLFLNAVFFNEDLHLDEDTLFNLKALSNAKSIKYIDYFGYLYKDNPESITRDFISNNVFEKILIKYNTNYKNILHLKISDQEMFQFQCSRLIYDVSFLIFKSITSKNLDSKTRNNFIVHIIKNKEVKCAVNFLHAQYISQLGRFEKLIIFCIRKQKVTFIILIATILNKVYTPNLSEIIRKFNK